MGLFPVHAWPTVAGACRRLLAGLRARPVPYAPRVAYAAAIEGVRRRAPALAERLDDLDCHYDGAVPYEVGACTLRLNAAWFMSLADEARVTALAGIAFELSSDLAWSGRLRDPFVWHLACTLFTNARLSAMGFELPHGALSDQACRGMTCEDVYARLMCSRDEGRVARRGF